MIYFRPASCTVKGLDWGTQRKASFMSKVLSFDAMSKKRKIQKDKVQSEKDLEIYKKYKEKLQGVFLQKTK